MEEDLINIEKQIKKTRRLILKAILTRMERVLKRGVVTAFISEKNYTKYMVYSVRKESDGTCISREAYYDMHETNVITKNDKDLREIAELYNKYNSALNLSEKSFYLRNNLEISYVLKKLELSKNIKKSTIINILKDL